MKTSAIRKRAVAVGVTERQLDDADDADNTRAALIELIVQQQRGGGGGGSSSEGSAGMHDRTTRSTKGPTTAEEEAYSFHVQAANFATGGKWPQAAEAWEAATELDPTNGTYWYYRGISSQKQERVLDAEKCWKRGSKLGHTQAGELLAVVRSKRAQEVSHAHTQPHT
jgi:tetratricopeptide (TPR) repeat protein